MRKFLLICGVFLLGYQLKASPFLSPGYFDNTTPFNKILFKHWSEQGIKFPLPASDAVFLRRVALTAAGRLPTAAEVREFLKDTAPDKRAKAIEKYLNDPGYTGMQAMRFADMLRIKSEFPVNLWPNAVQLWHRTLQTELNNDRPLNEMFYEMLTVSGSNFRVPHANFFRASADRSPRGLAAMVLLTTMGMKADKIAPETVNNMVPLFSRIRYKSTYEWKEEIVFTDYHTAAINAKLPDGTVKTFSSPEKSPRTVFADWLLKEKPGYFNRAITNRVWHWIFGKGIYPAADELPVEPNGISSNVPFSPEVQHFLEQELVNSNYSLRHLYRVIMNSAAFQASSLADSPEQIAHFAAYPIRRLEAELLIDALAQVTGSYDRYMSVIPEPFTFLPSRSRAVNIADGSISSGVLDTFGRPPRDSGALGERNTASTDSQNLYLMNSATLFRRSAGYTRRFSRFRNLDQALENIYLDILSRRPTAAERNAFHQYRKSLGSKQSMALQDTVWVLFNSKEFLFHH